MLSTEDSIYQMPSVGNILDMFNINCLNVCFEYSVTFAANFDVLSKNTRLI